MTTGQLAATLQGRHAQTREHVRRPVVIGQAVTAGGRPQPGRAYETVEDRAVAHAAFTLSAPEWATEAWRRSGPQQRAMIERALRTDDRLPARNRLDAWMNGHTGQAAQLVAVDRHLSERLHSRIAGEVDRAVLDPPDFVCTAIGSAPAPSAPERDEWVALTSTLVHDHHVAAASPAAGHEPPRRDP